MKWTFREFRRLLNERFSSPSAPREPILIAQDSPRGIARFIVNDHDLTGHVALSLYVQDRLQDNIELAQLLDIDGVADRSVTVIYRAAAAQIVKQHEADTALRRDEAASRDSALYILFQGLLAEKHALVVDRIETYARSNTLLRQILVSTISTAAIASFAYVIVKFPDLMTALKAIGGI